MNILVSGGQHPAPPKAAFNLETCLLGVRIRKRALDIAQRELLKDLWRRINTARSKTAKSLRGKERPGDADDTGGTKSNDSIGLLKFWYQWVVHRCKCGGSLPADHEIAVIPGSGKDAEAGANDFLASIERIGEADARLHVSVVGGI